MGCDCQACDLIKNYIHIDGFKDTNILMANFIYGQWK